MPEKTESNKVPGRMLNAAQAAEVLGISSRNVYSQAAPAGPIPCYRIGKRVSFDERELQEYKASCRCVQFKMPTPTLSRTMPKIKVRTPWLEPGESELEKTYRKLGITPRRTPSTGRKPKPSNKVK